MWPEARRAGLVVFLLASAGLLGVTPPQMQQKLGVLVPMRDGIRLSTNIFLPGRATRVPTILVRTPYGKGTELLPGYYVFIDRGYAVVFQDVRGRYGSEGVFRPMTQEVNDGDDTLNWIAKQPWSDGNIGMMGGSYLGISQWKAALSGNPHLKAICPVVSGDDDYRDRFYSPGGAMKLGHRLEWLSENLQVRGYKRPPFSEFVRHLPLRTADKVATGGTLELYQQALDHPSDDAFWQSVSTRAQLNRVKIPVLSVAGWYDNYVESDLEAFSTLQKLNPQHRIVVGPWPHNMSITFPGVDFGREFLAPVRRYQLDWFENWLKPGKVPMEPADGVSLHSPVHLFVMGANQWRDEQEWPLARTRYTAFYLSSRGSANTLDGDGVLNTTPPVSGKSDQFVYDSHNPVPTMGGAICCNPKVFPWGPMDQRSVERRKDVLVYTTPVLTHDMEVTGPIKLILYVSTTTPDTDFTAKLVDVFPDGEARNLTDGILRMRYWQSLEKPVRLTPGLIYGVQIDLGVTSNLFKAGHRIRLEVSSSNFPRFDRNPNTGKPIADETRLEAATQTVYHDKVSPSHLILPLIPAAPTRTARALSAKPW